MGAVRSARATSAYSCSRSEASGAVLLRSRSRDRMAAPSAVCARRAETTGPIDAAGASRAGAWWVGE
jgi:hypothetical protein